MEEQNQPFGSSYMYRGQEPCLSLSLSHCLSLSALPLPSDSVSLALCPRISVAKTVFVRGSILVDLANSNLISSQPLKEKEEKNHPVPSTTHALYSCLFSSSEAQGT